MDKERFICEKGCETSFARFAEQARHYRTVHSEVTHKCKFKDAGFPDCKFESSRRDNLDKHLRTVHGVEVDVSKRPANRTTNRMTNKRPRPKRVRPPRGDQPVAALLPLRPRPPSLLGPIGDHSGADVLSRADSQQSSQMSSTSYQGTHQPITRANRVFGAEFPASETAYAGDGNWGATNNPRISNFSAHGLTFVDPNRPAYTSSQWSVPATGQKFLMTGVPAAMEESIRRILPSLPRPLSQMPTNTGRSEIGMSFQPCSELLPTSLEGTQQSFASEFPVVGGGFAAHPTAHDGAGSLMPTECNCRLEWCYLCELAHTQTSGLSRTNE